MIECIFCGAKAEPSVEHVVPEFAGGSLKFNEVCQPCNSRMGSDFEGPISRSVLFRLPRHLHNIQGKSASPISPFPVVGTDEDGTKMRLDDEYRPYLLPEVSQRNVEGGIEVNLRVDASDANEIPRIIEQKIRRNAKTAWPEMSQTDVDALVEKAIAAIPTKHNIESFSPRIGFRESVDLNQLTFLFMKIAFETAFLHHGRRLLGDARNIALRDAIQSRDATASIGGRLFPNPDPFAYITAPASSHLVALIGNACYVRLFNLTAIIEVCSEQSASFLSPLEWVAYLFNYQKGTHVKVALAEFVAKDAV